MDKRELICICCPLGCNLEVDLSDKDNIKVKGSSCRRGEEYGIKECTNPTRIVTTTVFVKNRSEEVLPVKTERDIPKDRIFDCVRVLSYVTAEAPVKIGDVIVENVLDTGVNIVATKNIAVK
jgi:CxxC motif-containing protein